MWCSVWEHTHTHTHTHTYQWVWSSVCEHTHTSECGPQCGSTHTHTHTPVSVVLSVGASTHTHTHQWVWCSVWEHTHTSKCGPHCGSTHTHTPVSVVLSVGAHTHTPVSVVLSVGAHTHTHTSECGAQCGSTHTSDHFTLGAGLHTVTSLYRGKSGPRRQMIDITRRPAASWTSIDFYQEKIQWDESKGETSKEEKRRRGHLLLQLQLWTPLCITTLQVISLNSRFKPNAGNVTNQHSERCWTNVLFLNIQMSVKSLFVVIVVYL